jgi:hypothetical protein
MNILITSNQQLLPAICFHAMRASQRHETYTRARRGHTRSEYEAKQMGLYIWTVSWTNDDLKRLPYSATLPHYAFHSYSKVDL